MKSFFRFTVLSAGLLACSLSAAQTYTGYPSLSKAEALQLTQNMSPKARSELAKREAYAAYEESLAACKKMERAERKACTAQAKDYLQNDLEYARNILTEDTSAGSSAGGATNAEGGRTASAGTTSDRDAADIERIPVVVVLSPREQYQLAVREANAAYAEAVRACKAHARTDRTACMKEASANLRSDIAYAKRLMGTGERSRGGGSDAGMSGSRQ